MPTVSRMAAAVALVLAAATAAAAQHLKPQWSRPVGGKTRFVGVEEYGRCSVFIDNGVIQVVNPAGEIAWTWAFGKISKFLNPRDVAVAHGCDAVAVVGDASYKRALIAERGGHLTTLLFEDTPAEIRFDRSDRFVAIGTYLGSLSLFSRDGGLRWIRATDAAIVQGITFTDDNQRIMFKSYGGSGTVSMAGHVESSTRQAADADGETRSPLPYYRWRVARSEDGTRMWLRGEDSIDCVDASGRVLATIDATPSMQGVQVSRDFTQVLVVTEKDLRQVSVERYEIAAPCANNSEKLKVKN
jgi:hypothetical protein